MKASNFTVDFNQFLAFSPLYASTDAAETIFWPGCAAMKLAPEILLAAFKALQSHVPGLGFSSWCCAKPTFAAGSKARQQKRQGQLTAYFAQNGIRRVYTLCPNCRLTLQKQTAVEVLPAWPLLARFAEQNGGKSKQFTARYILHDPCAAREDAASQQAARRILQARGISFAEFNSTAAGTRCCGRKNMLFLTNPPAAKKMLQKRLEEAKNLPIVTYCESCAEAFGGAGHPAVHLLEILFDIPASRGIINRIHNAHRKDFYA